MTLSVHVIGLALSVTVVASPAAAQCVVGDCNGDGRSTVDDVLTMVDVAHGDASISSCPEGDLNGDNRITVDELVAAVIAAMSGCGAWDY